MIYELNNSLDRRGGRMLPVPGPVVDFIKHFISLTYPFHNIWSLDTIDAVFCIPNREMVIPWQTVGDTVSKNIGYKNTR